MNSQNSSDSSPTPRFDGIDRSQAGQETPGEVLSGSRDPEAEPIQDVTIVQYAPVAKTARPHETIVQMPSQPEPPVTPSERPAARTTPPEKPPRVANPSETIVQLRSDPMPDPKVSPLPKPISSLTETIAQTPNQDRPTPNYSSDTIVQLRPPGTFPAPGKGNPGETIAQILPNLDSSPDPSGSPSQLTNPREPIAQIPDRGSPNETIAQIPSQASSRPNETIAQIPGQGSSHPNETIAQIPEHVSPNQTIAQIPGPVSSHASETIAQISSQASSRPNETIAQIPGPENPNQTIAQIPVPTYPDQTVAQISEAEVPRETVAQVPTSSGAKNLVDLPPLNFEQRPQPSSGSTPNNYTQSPDSSYGVAAAGLKINPKVELWKGVAIGFAVGLLTGFALGVWVNGWLDRYFQLKNSSEDQASHSESRLKVSALWQN